MNTKGYILLFLQLLWSFDGSSAQHSSYSLQAAVDELHRREAAKYPLNAPPSQHYFGSAFGTVPDQDYWNEDSELSANTNNQNSNHHRLNKALAKFLERENYKNDYNGLSLGPFSGYEFDEDSNNIYNGYTDEMKRSSAFRERDNNFDNNGASVFRERDPELRNEPEQAELTEQFLREIEETADHEREERYKEALRHLWEKYQQQENQIDSDVFEEKKRMRTPPYYMLMQKKRSYPVLPWLPYSSELKKKRFPVAKRSTNENTKVDKTDEKVQRELSELFGKSNDNKKKRSTVQSSHQHAKSTASPDAVSTLKTDMQLEVVAKKQNTTESAMKAAPMAAEHSHHGHNHAGHHEHTHSDHESHEDDEDSEEADDEEDIDDEHEDFENDEDDAQKKKRDITIKKSKGEVLLPEHLINLRKKKSIEWSKYFGLDLNGKKIDVKKRSAIEDSDNYDNKKNNHDLDPDKLANMDKKLQTIEDFIIDETIKYTGAHEGTTSPEEIQRLKDQVLSRLATAYSLEKMRRALEKLRHTVDAENHLLRNVIENEPQTEKNENLEYQKRLSVKKEKTPNLIENLHVPTGDEQPKDLNSNAMMSAATGTHEHNNNLNAKEADKNLKKQQKKRNGFLRYPELSNGFTDFDEDVDAGRYEPLNDAYLGNKNYILGSNQCPLIESMAERCHGVDLLSGDSNQELLPICGIHQICYLCGTSKIACDYQYLTRADSICENNSECQEAARSILMILRGTPGPQLGPRRCLKNTCLYSAMREIGL